MTVAYGIKGKVSLLKLMKTDICHLVPNLPYAVRCRNGKFTNSSRKFLSLSVRYVCPNSTTSGQSIAPVRIKNKSTFL